MPTSHDSALFILANNQEETSSIVQIPRNISRKELQELIPLQWVTGYEKLRENTKPLSTSQATFRRSVDGLVTTTFKKPDEASSSNSSEVFHSLMIKPRVKEDSIMPIFVVKADGSVIYSDKVNGHFWGKQYHQLSKEIARLEEEWRKSTFGAESDAKEREIRRLKAQVQDLD